MNELVIRSCSSIVSVSVSLHMRPSRIRAFPSVCLLRYLRNSAAVDRRT